MKTMMMNFSADRENKKIKVEREFAAPVAQVWAAWTQSDLLDQWWAPKPWKAITRSMDFREGGSWVYGMQGPDGTTHWCRVDYTKIDAKKSFAAYDAFTDDKGNINPELPRMLWTNTFNEHANNTIVNIEISFDKLADLEKIIEMGFKEGFTMGLGNLDELLASRQQSTN